MGQERQNTRSRRLGAWLGRVFRGYLSYESRVVGRSQAADVPVWLTKALLWTIKLCLLGVFLYLAFWVAVIAILSVLGVWRISRSDLERYENRLEWRDGLLGYGLYDETGTRVDPYDPDEQT